MATLRRFFRHDPKKNRIFCIDELRILLRGTSNTSHAVSDFEIEVLVTHCLVLPLWVEVFESLVTLGGWVILNVKSHWTILASANFCRTAKSFGWLSNNFLRSSLISPCLIAAEQHAYCSGGKINLWSHLCEERPENAQNVKRNPSCSRIESIKSARKRFEKVAFLISPRHFLETHIWCRICISKNAILQVNPLDTSLQLLLLCPFATFVPC